MKYIKTYENKKAGIFKKNLDKDTVYVYDERYAIFSVIGKPRIHLGGFVLVGFALKDLDKGERFSIILNGDYFPTLRLATPEEIEQYEMWFNAKKYNL